MNKAEKINLVISNISLLETPVSQSQIKSANVADLDKWIEEINLKLSNSSNEEEEDKEEEIDTDVSNTQGLEVRMYNVTTSSGKEVIVSVVMLEFIKFSDTGNLLFKHNNKTVTCPTRLAIKDFVAFEKEHKGTMFPIKMDSLKDIVSTKRAYKDLMQGLILESNCSQFDEIREEARLKTLQETQKRQQLKALTIGKSQEEKELIRNYSTLVSAKTGLESLGLDVDPALLAMIINK